MRHRRRKKKKKKKRKEGSDGRQEGRKEVKEGKGRKEGRKEEFSSLVFLFCFLCLKYYSRLYLKLFIRFINDN